MSTYCIGDIHGRYDMLMNLLEVIKFNKDEDFIYFLGDVVNVNYGGVMILLHIMKHNESMQLLQGNHEYHYIEQRELYDMFFLNPKISGEFREFIRVYMDNFLDIADAVKGLLSQQSEEKIVKNKEVKKWVSVSNKRVQLLEKTLLLIKAMDYDEDSFFQLTRICGLSSRHFNSKNFIKELVEFDEAVYSSIFEFLASCEERAEIECNDREFVLLHGIYGTKFNMQHIQDHELCNKHIVFGHEPVAKIHRQISEYSLDFDYREVLSYIDRNNNRYFNLDMTDNVLSALRLEDLEEFYVSRYRRPTSISGCPPITQACDRKVHYRLVEEQFLWWSRPKKKLNKRGYSFINYRDNCMEYIVSVNTYHKVAYFKRVDYFDFDEVHTVDIPPELINDYPAILAFIKHKDSQVAKLEKTKEIEETLRRNLYEVSR